VEALRRRQPMVELHTGDISDEPAELGGPFDIVSAMSVLLHITDPDRFERAVSNLSGLLASDGIAFVMDPVVVQTWWGPPFAETSNGFARSAAGWARPLDRAGLEVVEILPVTWLLSNPIDTRCRLAWK